MSLTTFQAEYGMNALFPQDWNSLIQRFIADPGLLQKYAKYARINRYSPGQTSYSVKKRVSLFPRLKRHGASERVSGSRIDGFFQ